MDGIITTHLVVTDVSVVALRCVVRGSNGTGPPDTQGAADAETAGGHGGGGSWFAPGTQEGPNGILFAETPLLPGQKRKWEDWEASHYFTGILTTLMLTVGLPAKPDTRIETWAHIQALERLAAEEEAEAS
ncbi:uncharacterized protein [Physcomitrium patens]|uniref:uncharacterized protein n=1 Tax=Physcomitrium patens TaxID=3218 RepID=UPI000D166FB5|nr:uncharacterized protein LOC112281584 [Physcomitrium patens]|eukprot:XP_024374002.1 uncharacterized protein LOC112281584 [Physcomitrella patens]